MSRRFKMRLKVDIGILYIGTVKFVAYVRFNISLQLHQICDKVW